MLCGHQEGFAVDVLGGLIGPVGEDARSKAPLWVHRECAIWSPEVRLSLVWSVLACPKLLARQSYVDSSIVTSSAYVRRINRPMKLVMAISGGSAEF